MADFKYPLPKFYFKVEWDDKRFGFTEVSGLDFETEVIEYREGSMVELNKTKQPGLRKYADIVLKRGIILEDITYFQIWDRTKYFQELKSDNKYRRAVTISLLNEEQQPIFVWTLKNAWPSKVQSTDLKADANEVAIEQMTLVHEGLTMTLG